MSLDQSADGADPEQRQNPADDEVNKQPGFKDPIPEIAAGSLAQIPFRLLVQVDAGRHDLKLNELLLRCFDAYSAQQED